MKLIPPRSFLVLGIIPDNIVRLRVCAKDGTEVEIDLHPHQARSLRSELAWVLKGIESPAPIAEVDGDA